MMEKRSRSQRYILAGLLSVCACDGSVPTSQDIGETEGDDAGDEAEAGTTDSLPQCEVETPASADFVVEIDGSPVWTDDRVLDLENAWYVETGPERSFDIDADCETVAQEDGALTLRCPGAEDDTHDIVLSVPGGDLEPLPETVRLRYVTHFVRAEFGNPDIVGHAFALFDEGDLIAAGILARSELSRWGAHEAFADVVGWEGQPPGCAARFDRDACFGFQPQSVSLTLGTQTGVVRSGETATVGDYEVHLGLAEQTLADPAWPQPESGGNGCAGFEMHHALVVRAP